MEATNNKKAIASFFQLFKLLQMLYKRIFKYYENILQANKKRYTVFIKQKI